MKPKQNVYVILLRCHHDDTDTGATLKSIIGGPNRKKRFKAVLATVMEYHSADSYGRGRFHDWKTERALIILVAIFGPLGACEVPKECSWYQVITEVVDY